MQVRTVRIMNMPYLLSEHLARDEQPCIALEPGKQNSIQYALFYPLHIRTKDK